MKITFVLPNIGICGGTRCIFECSNRLIEKGHTVNIIHPLIPIEFRSKRGLSYLIFSILTTIKHLMKGNRVSWFKVKAKLIRVLYFSRFIEKSIPESDLIIATAAETAYFVSSLSDNQAKKLYFVQHYEVWELWNSDACWKKLEQFKGDPKKMSMNMALIEPADICLKKYKATIDKTYKLPLIKFTTSTWLKNLIEEKFGEKVIGRVDIGNNFQIFSVNQFKEKKNNLIVMPLRGRGWKGSLEGIKALELVRKQIPQVKVVFYGHKSFKDLAPDWGEFRADISDAELRLLYQAADVFVLPSWVEGWSSPPMEAMACGTACVCTDVGAVADYSIPGKTVILVPARDYQSLATACIDLLKNDQKRNSIAQEGYQYIQQFTWERTVTQLEQIFQELCDKIG